jgi:hypothetical protein
MPHTPQPLHAVLAALALYVPDGHCSHAMLRLG